MKKIVVVVNRNAIVFKGNLDVIDSSGHTSNIGKTLVVRNKATSPPETIAVFNDWSYWREMGGKEKSPSSTAKVLIRPNKIISSKNAGKFWKSFTTNQVSFIPNGWQIVVISKNGDIEVL